MAKIKFPGAFKEAKVYLNAPAGPTVALTGATGTTSYSYYIIAKDGNGKKTQMSAAGTITNGNATLSASNYNKISWNPVENAVSYEVIRKVGAGGYEKIADRWNTYFEDKGTVGTVATPPAINETSQIITEITVSSSAPSTPATNSLWVDLSV